MQKTLVDSCLTSMIACCSKSPEVQNICQLSFSGSLLICKPPLSMHSVGLSRQSFWGLLTCCLRFFNPPIACQCCSRPCATCAGMRIFRMLLSKKQLEQKQIADFAMVPVREAREVLYKMLQGGFLALQVRPWCLWTCELPRGHQPSFMKTLVSSG